MSSNREEVKPKKVKPPPPPCPPEVSTACLVIRTLILQLFRESHNNSNNIIQHQPFQATYLKEPCTGKLGFLLVKDKRLIEFEDFWTLFQKILDDLFEKQEEPTSPQQRQVPIRAFAQSLSEWKQHQPEELDKSHDKLNDDTQVWAGQMTQSITTILPSQPLSSLRGMHRIVIDGPQSSIKKVKKDTQLTIKFQVVLKENTDSDGSLAQEDTLIDTPKLDFDPKYQEMWDQAMNEEEGEIVPTPQTATATAATVEDEEMVVNIEQVTGKIDYNKLVDQFGSSLITDDLLKQLQQATNVELHRFLRRNIFFSHRDFDVFLKQLLKPDPTPVYLYTGRGPSSSSMHLGHLIPFLFTKWLQEAFGCPLVIQMTDDEKFIFKGKYEDGDDNLLDFQNLTMENAKDIIACGFDFDKTFIFSDLDYVGTMYPNIVRIWKAVTTNSVNGIFGFDGTSNIGKIAFPAVQAAPSFASSFPTVLNAQRDSDMLCLIPCAIDQDPYFRMTRDIAHKLVQKGHALGGKPALIHSKFFPPLQGATGKMSSSDTNSAIFLTDTPEEIERKIKEHAFSGGKETKKEQEMYGADIDIDVSYQWLRFFLEDDEELERIGKDYSSGSGEFWSTGKVKARLIEVLKKLVAEHQERRAKVTDEEVRKWMQERKLT